jgi:hypothetical protein
MIYEGEVRNGMYNGYGRMIYESNDVFIGSLRNLDGCQMKANDDLFNKKHLFDYD